MIKKIVVLSLISFFMAGFTYAVNVDTAIVNARVEVASVFEISLDRPDIDFGEMRPGETKTDIPATGIKVKAKTNTGNRWYLLMNAISELRFGDKYIDNKYFSWYGWSEGQGKWYATGETPMSLVPFTVYESTTDEGINLPNGTTNVFKFKLDLPRDQVAGKYETIVRFTLTE